MMVRNVFTGGFCLYAGSVAIAGYLNPGFTIAFSFLLVAMLILALLLWRPTLRLPGIVERALVALPTLWLVFTAGLRGFPEMHDALRISAGVTAGLIILITLCYVSVKGALSRSIVFHQLDQHPTQPTTHKRPTTRKDST